jgi:hypothetical protein
MQQNECANLREAAIRKSRERCGCRATVREVTLPALTRPSAYSQLVIQHGLLAAAVNNVFDEDSRALACFHAAF